MPAAHIVVPPGAGSDYDWTNDHVFVKSERELTDGRVTVVEDHLKPGFDLARHHHRSMVEIFYILEGAVSFEFDDESVGTIPGTTVIIRPGEWHRVHSPGGGRLLTVFSPGGFDHYLSELDMLSEDDLADPVVVARLAERYDIWR